MKCNIWGKVLRKLVWTQSLHQLLPTDRAVLHGGGKFNAQGQASKRYTLFLVVFLSSLFIYLFILILTWAHFFIAFRERKGEREISMLERALIGCLSYTPVPGDHTHPYQGLYLQSRYVPWPGTEPATLWLQDDAPVNWATPAMATQSVFSAFGTCSFFLEKNSFKNTSYCTVLFFGDSLMFKKILNFLFFKRVSRDTEFYNFCQ